MKRLVDTHCHIDLYRNYNEVINEIDQRKIATIAVTNAPSVFRKCCELTAHSKYIRTALGLHPELAAARRTEIGLFEALAPETRFVGEVGLDFVRGDAGERRVQIDVFERIVAVCRQAGDKVLTVHSRKAEQAVLDCFGDEFPGKVILHWYSGPLRLVEQALLRGFYFSVNPAMTYSEKGRSIVCALPMDRVLTESDGPFAQVQGNPAVPQDVGLTVEYLSKIWKLSPDETADQIYSNFRKVLATTTGSPD